MSRDGHIRLLPLQVANKIAAGEVIERPASVLKELVENALDAGATRIDITIAAGGRKLVSVRDNGCGMSREDALLSLERQATSKIRDVDDIERIDTLGFRGEAIPSIASVSRFTLTTRSLTSDEGTRLTVNAGALAGVDACGAPAGTCVEVRDLFCNVPARRKFLRAYTTEEAHIRSVFTVHALARPDVGFSLLLDGREIYRFAPGATLEERIHDLFGTALSDSLLAFGSESTSAGVSVHGYIERPNASLSLRRDQFIFINGRPATAPAITYAVREAYPRRDADARPALILFIDLPPTQVDVNVHPSKREVRFRRSADVREAILSALGRAFHAAPDTVTSAVPRTIDPGIAPPPPVPSETDVFKVPFSTAPDAAVVTRPEVFTEPKTETETPRPAPLQPVLPPSVQTMPTEADLRTAAGPWRWFRFLAETQSGYLLLETDAGLVTLNPKAARERIAYERLLESGRTLSQPLLIPETTQLPPADSARLRNFRKELESTGFQIEEFGHDTWKIDAVPDLVSGVPAAPLLASIAVDIAETGVKRGGVRWREELVAKTVARSFSGASLKLTPEGAVKLVEELAATRMPYVCPRGKPVMTFVSNAELNRKFDR